MSLSHTTPDYICPICLGNQGIENDETLLKQADLIWKSDTVMVWLNSFWIPGNEGHVIIVPTQHYENLYSVPPAVGAEIFEVSQKTALAMKKAYECDGTTLRQNNEPAGDQHALHYHLHVFPRYEGDDFNQAMVAGSYLSEPQLRSEYMAKLKRAI